MKTVIRTLIGAGCCATLFATGAAQAHYLWIESSDTGARLYFGEADALVKEKSPGKLDNIRSPQAFAASTNGKTTPAEIRRAAEYFTISAATPTHAMLAAEESLEVRDLTKHGLGFAKSNYYARQGQAATAAETPLALDIQGCGANTFTVLYRGHPLPNAKLELIAPNTWVQQHTSDAQGVVQINTPWRGQYILHVLHVDNTSNEFAGKRYDNLRNHFTYSFVTENGADPGPAVPPKHAGD